MKAGTKVVAALGTAAMLLPLAACGSSNGSSSSSDGGKTQINVWSWDLSQDMVDLFEKNNPNIDVKLTNAGTNKDEYTALNNALQAGSGAPDVAQIEYYALPEYVIKQQVEDLTQFGADKYKSFFTPGTWSSVNINGGVYGLPSDSGPMVFLYNKAVFDKAGISEAPKTWDEYYEAAKKLRAVDSYIANDTGDAGFYDSMVWQAGGHPFSTSKDGKTVTINLTGDKGTQKWTNFWGKMIKEGLIDTKTSAWTDDWNKGLGDGSISGLLTGSWISINIATNSPNATGQWRVAQLPQWKEGETANSENGGSSLAVIKSNDDKKKEAAYKFVDFVTHSKKGIDYRDSLGAFPANNKSLQKQSFLDMTTVKAGGKDVDYYGGQKYNVEMATASKNVTTGYEFLPFEVYARGKYSDFVGESFTGDQPLSEGIAAWQKDLVTYAKSQGFTVKEG